MAKKDQKIFHIDAAIAKDFKTKCEQMNVPASHIVEELIKDWLAGMQVKELDALFAPYIEKAIDKSIRKVGDRLMGPMHNIQVDVMGVLLGFGVFRDALVKDMEGVIDRSFDHNLLIPKRAEQSLSRRDTRKQNSDVVIQLQERSALVIQKRYARQKAEKAAERKAKEEA